MADPAPGTAAELARQLDAEKITALTERVEELRSQNEDLRGIIDKNEKDTHEFVAFFQREMEIKDEIIV
eukprot:CAMPEP_0118875248 /NCGR_PEP_ID=MMETSP1163-20130328/16381_1 /TAXON_ID=124430 /ORGANISM="Phaeomonas parva, Strain CCMP2877" /LENGTH=68 /DNA_ID=CAMNT_0006810719 /DNA_START=329 /DNA_END=531 /DNA_ORIENTATION=-